MLSHSELRALEEVRAALMTLHGQQAFAGSDDLSAEVIDMQLMIAPMDKVMAWGRLKWTYGMSREEAETIMCRWHTEDGRFKIGTLECLDEVVRIARAIKKAFPACDVHRCAQRAAFTGSINAMNLRTIDNTLPAESRAEARAIMKALKSP
jgi:hypothetical protein